MGFKGLDVSNPGALIGVVVLVFIAVKLAVVMIPLLTTALVELGSIDNFSFSGLFQSSGLMQIIVSSLFLIGILAIIGYNTRSKR